jgi:hypothetical protein
VLPGQASASLGARLAAAAGRGVLLLLLLLLRRRPLRG